MLPPATLYPTMTLPNPMPTDVNPDNAGAETEAELGIEGEILRVYVYNRIYHALDSIIMYT